jgi:2-hydroxychromene-2-carboxylate isomerase
VQNWARFAGIELIQPTVFPVRAVEALRAIIAAGEKNKLHEFATACFEAYWQKDRDISQAQILDLLAQKVGLDPIWLGERRKAPEIKEKLRSNTEELMSRGGFGSPTMYVGGQMFFGNDRMELVDAALRETVAA